MSAPALTSVDLMLDCVFGSATDRQPQTILHVIRFGDNHFNIVRDGKVSMGLGFDEMLGEVVNMLHPKLGNAHYREQTREQWHAEQQRHDDLAPEAEHERDSDEQL